MESSTRYALTPVAGAIAAALSPAQSALAQDSNDATLEEIIVTATKRKSNIQDLPQAITAFSTDDIKRQGFLNISGSDVFHHPRREELAQSRLLEFQGA